MKLRVAILAALLLSAVVAVYFLAVAEGLPTTQASTTLEATYNASTAFDYRAPIVPNLLYNQTSITAGHGTLFTSMISVVKLSYTYTVNLSNAEPVSLIVQQSLVASTPGWSWVVNASKAQLIPSTTATTVTGEDSMYVNITSLLKTYRAISNVTLYNPTGLVLSYEALVFTQIAAPGGGTSFLAGPSLNLTYGGSYFAPSNLTERQGGVVSALGDTPIASTGLYRTLAAGVLAIVLIAIAVLGYLEWAERRGPARPIDPEEEVGKLTEPYKDAIAMTLSLPHRENIVVMRGWEDLIHAADMLSKPVLHLENRVEGEVRHIFYVVDGAVQYVFIYGTAGREPGPDATTGRASDGAPPGARSTFGSGPTRPARRERS